MQPANLSLDPAVNLWSNNPSNNNLFTQTSSPDSNSDATYGMTPNFYSQNIGGVLSGAPETGKSDSQGPTLSATAPNATGGENGGEVFMGVSSPQPGGVPSWKWTVMSDKK